MSKETGVLVAGVLVFLSPFLGIPGSWRLILLVVLGAIIAILGFLLRGQVLGRVSKIMPQESHPHAHQTFIESSVIIREYTEGGEAR